MNNITFAGDGPLMQGHWHNYKTGDSFTVADTYFQDNQYLIKTTDGRLLDASRIGDYVQVNKPIPKGQDTIATTKPREVLPKEVTDLIEGPKTMNYSTPDTHQFTIAPAVDINYEIIKKALGVKTIPTAEFTVSWKKFPKTEISTVRDIMGIDINYIIDWYISQISTNDIFEKYKEAVKNFIKTEMCEETKVTPKKTNKK